MTNNLKKRLFGRVARRELLSESFALDRKLASEEMKAKWRCLLIMHSTTFSENQTQHMSTNNSYQLSSTVVKG